MGRWLVVAVVVVASSPLVACGAGPDGAPAAAAGRAFYADVGQGRMDRACGLLAEQTRRSLERARGTSCPQALAAVGLSARGVEAVDVYGRQALVRMHGDSLFVAQQSSGWRITAAGCTPHTDEPYDCTVEAG